MTRSEFRAAYRIARLVVGFERDCLDNRYSSLGASVRPAAYSAACRYGDVLRFPHSALVKSNRLCCDTSRPRLPA